MGLRKIGVNGKRVDIGGRERLGGRLLVYDSMGPNKDGTWSLARVYLELQDAHIDGIYFPLEIYLDLDHSLQFEVQDGAGWDGNDRGPSTSSG